MSKEIKIRSDKEIINKLKWLKNRVYCSVCNVLCEIDYDGDLTCPKCLALADGNWCDLGAYLALLYVLGEREYIFEKDEERKRI
jgi:hypothetical protein